MDFHVKIQIRSYEKVGFTDYILYAPVLGIFGCLFKEILNTG